MTPFAPPQTRAAATPDPLAEAVVQGLSRPIGKKQAWGVVQTLGWAILSFGIVPLVAWMKGFAHFCVGEQQQLIHLARWVRQNTPDPQAQALEARAMRLTPRRWLSALSVLVLLGTAGLIAAIVTESRRDGFDTLLAGTWGFGRRWILDYRVHKAPESASIYGLWLLGLSLAYGLLWLQVHLHARDLRRFVQRFNAIAQPHGVGTATVEPLGIPLRPLWIAAAVCLWALHAPWGIMAMLAGAAQRRYITYTSRGARAELAQRLRAMLTQRQVFVPVPVYLRQRCVEPRCRAELPLEANFCRRCGTRQQARARPVA